MRCITKAEKGGSRKDAKDAKNFLQIVSRLGLDANPCQGATVYNSMKCSSEKACDRSENNVFTLPHTLPNNTDFRYFSRSSGLFQWLRVA